MDFKLILLAIGIAFGSCADLKESVDGAMDAADNIWKGKQTLTVTFQSHRPYCGGAAPTEAQSAGFTNPIANQVFYIYKDERPSSITKMVRVKTDENGKLSIDLKDGTYSIISEDKALPIDEFIKKKKIEGDFYQYSADSCFETWRTTPDLTVEISNPMVETVTIQQKCYTGDNPCMKYTGPYPP
ncbi:MAG: prealbumin-like fold domain-containing protein [Crocinitomicaceae bacterium]|nr:prealbumin-like fold domain-containing protein [Crocinitomicaceae bacterium]